LGGFAGQLGYRLGRVRNPPLADAGPLHDPLIRRLQPLLEPGIGDDPRRHGHAESRHCREGALKQARVHARAASRCAISAPICWLRLARTAWRATRTACLMALELDDPWQMIGMPRTPRSGAPPYSE